MKIWYVSFSSSESFQISFDTCSLTHGLYIVLEFGDFPDIFLLLISRLIFCMAQRIYFVWFLMLNFLNMLRLFYDPVCGLSWQVFLVHLKRMCIQLFSLEWYCLMLLWSCWFFVSLFYCSKRSMKASTMAVVISPCPLLLLLYFNVFFLCVHILNLIYILGAFTLSLCNEASLFL